ncbi:MAG: PaaI family thioesterase [Bacteroidia bacterium]|nr:PaaI family thioesterase [Bacteroidia bacterium]
MDNSKFEYTWSKVKKNSFLKHIGLEITKIEDGIVEAEVSFKTFLEQQDGWFHGGVISTLCDVVAGFASYSTLKEGERTVTVEIKVSYLYPAKGGLVKAKGVVIKRGRRFNFCESEVFAMHNDEWKLCAKATTTMAVIKPD